MNCYLILTNSYRLINEKIEELTKKDSELLKYDYETTGLDLIIEEASYSSLFIDSKTIVVYNCDFFSGSGKLDETLEKKLLNYLNNTSNSNTVIFVSGEKKDNRKKICKAFSNNTIDLLKLSYYDVLKYVENYNKKRKYNFNNDILNYLMKQFNQNYDLICNEMDKIYLCFSGECNLDNAKKIISNNLNDNVFKLVDSVVNNNYQLSVKCLDELKILKIEPLNIFSLLVREFRLIMHVKIAKSNNMFVDDILKKDGLADWQISKVLDEAKSYSLEKIKNIFGILMDYDYKFKSGIINSDLFLDLLFMDLLY